MWAATIESGSSAEMLQTQAKLSHNLGRFGIDNSALWLYLLGGIKAIKRAEVMTLANAILKTSPTNIGKFIPLSELCKDIFGTKRMKPNPLLQYSRMNYPKPETQTSDLDGNPIWFLVVDGELVKGAHPLLDLCRLEEFGDVQTSGGYGDDNKQFALTACGKQDASILTMLVHDNILPHLKIAQMGIVTSDTDFELVNLPPLVKK